MSAAPIVAVLAGGRGSRLGGSKAMVELGGRPLISRPLAAAAAAGLEAMVVAKRDTPLPRLDVAVVLEPDDPRHPLTGLVAALEAGRGNAILALGCDMPFVTGPLLASLGGATPPTVATLDGELEPLLGLYGPGDAEPLRAALGRGESLRSAVASLAPARFDESSMRPFGDPRALAFSVNTPADLDAAAEGIAGPGR
jgi:molybdopterin-guanine dinucleotide biosynthesis protein A